MRLCLNVPDESPFSMTALAERVGGDPWGIALTIDGVECTLAVAADSDEGWADVLERNEAGDIILDGEGWDAPPKIKRVYGKVEFRYNGEVLT